jgi:hypothetical protein
MLNRTTSSRIISKQECMVESTDLPLTICSEIIQTISISGSAKVTTDKSIGKRSYIDLYKTRPISDDNKSFSQFVFEQNMHVQPEKFVPHFVGMNNSPTYPVSSSYARSTLIIHIPWRDAYYHRLDNTTCIKEFHEKIDRNEFPSSVKLNYLQAKHRYEQSLMNKAVATETDDDSSDMDEDDRFMLQHMATLNDSMNENTDMDTEAFHRGLDYDWSIRHTVS